MRPNLAFIVSCALWLNVVIYVVRSADAEWLHYRIADNVVLVEEAGVAEIQLLMIVHSLVYTWIEPVHVLMACIAILKAYTYVFPALAVECAVVSKVVA